MYTVVIIDNKLNNNPTFISSINWQRCGFELVGYSNIGEEGVRLVKNLNPDILITEGNIVADNGDDILVLARNFKRDLEIVFFSEIQEFSHAQKAASFNAMEYILKPITSSSFEAALVKIRTSLDGKKKDDTAINFAEFRDYFLASILLQRHAESEMSQRIENLSLNLLGEEFLIVNISFKTNDPKEKPALSFFNTVKNIFKKYLNGECLVLNGMITIIVADHETNIKKHLSFMLMDILQSLEVFPGVKAVIGVSNRFTSILLSPIAYQQAKNAMLYSFREKNEVVLFKDIKRKELEPSFFEDIKNNLERKIRFETEDSVRDYINAIFNEIKISKISLSNFYMCLFEMISVCNNIEVKEFNQNLKFSFLESIVNNQSIDLIQLRIIEKSCELCQKIIGQRQNGVEKIVDQAIMLISENYKNPDFSLKILSQILHISSNYLCAIIKKFKNDSFIGILTEVRMNKSKELLLCTNSRIQEIAYDVGYTDQHYFSYCFRRFFNMTPKEMREQGVKNLTSLSE